MLWRTLQPEVETVLREIIRTAKPFFRDGTKPFWHLISCFSPCYKNTEAFSSECFENSICTRLSCCIRSTCNAFLGDMRFAVNDHEEHLTLIFFQCFCAQSLGCLMEAHISRLLLSKGYVLVNCLQQNLAFSWISLSNGTNWCLMDLISYTWLLPNLASSWQWGLSLGA